MEVTNGHDGAESTEEAFASVYRELRRMAEQHMSRQHQNHTLQTTALVNEAYVKLAGREGAYGDRMHFMRLASRAMRQVLIDYARQRHTRKRDGNQLQVEADEIVCAYDERSGGLLDLEGGLVRLEKRDPKLAELVELRFFGGRTMEEVARMLDISERQAHRWWTTARLFLKSAVDVS